MRVTLIFLCLIALFADSAYAESKITFFRDGALFQTETVAVKGAIDIPLAADILEQSFTIVPAKGTAILAVEIRKSDLVSASDKDLETLAEQRRRLEDRLQALETREAIFTSAAKAQSGKAPRKSKANPDPMQTIRQGTDFAIAQLEAVYTARRKTTQELHKIDARIATARKGNRSIESSVHITVTPPRGKVTLRYATTERGWQPQYNLYLASAAPAQLQLSARMTGSTRGDLIRVSSGSLAENSSAKTFPVRPGGVVIADYRLPITEVRYTDGIFNHFSATITNNSQHYLPSGNSGLFREGTYLGTFRFEGLSSGRSRIISLGK